MDTAGPESGVCAVARDIQRCEELEAVLDGTASGCGTVVSYQGRARRGRWYVPEPWAGHLDSAPILFVSSNPGAGPRNERFDPLRHMSRQDTDADLLAAADGAFDDLRFPGIADGMYNRDRSGNRATRPVPFWRWCLSIARELLGRAPVPGADYALTEVVHCGSAGEEGVPEALPICTSRYLRRVLGVSPARVVVVVGATARRAFEEGLMHEFTGDVRRFPPSAWIWRNSELAGMARYVVALPHPNARVRAHDVGGNIGADLTAEMRGFLNGAQPPARPATAAQSALPLERPGTGVGGAGSADPMRAGGSEQAAMPRLSPAPRLFAIATRQRDRNDDPTLMAGVNYVVKAVRTPWKPGAIRVIHVTGRDPDWQVGELVDLVNGNTGQKLGTYEVIAGYLGRATIWDLH